MIKRALLVFPFLLYIIFSLSNLDQAPFPLFDEPLYAETAYNVMEFGTLTNRIGGASGKQFFLYPLFLSQFFEFGDVTLFWARLSSVVLGLLSMLLFLRLLQTFKLPHLWITAGLTAFMFLNTLFVSFRIIRPESMHIFLFLLVFTFYFNLDRSRLLHWSILGIFMSLLTINHFIGLLTCLGLGLVIGYDCLKNKEFKPLFGVLLGGIPGGIIFVLNFINQYGGLTAYLDAHNASSKITLTGSLVSLQENISIFLNKYVMGVKRGFIVITEVVVLLLALRSRDKRLVLLSFVTLFFILYGMVTIWGFLRPYYSVLPAVTLLILLLWSHESSKKRLAQLVLGVYVLNHVAGSFYYYFSFVDHFKVTDFEHFSDHIIHKDYPIIGHKEFWYLSPDNIWMVKPKKDMLSPVELLTQYSGYYVMVTDFTKHRDFSNRTEGFRTYIRNGKLLAESPIYNTKLYLIEGL